MGNETGRNYLLVEDIVDREKANRAWHREKFGTALYLLARSQDVNLAAYEVAQEAETAGIDVDLMFALTGIIVRSMRTMQAFISLFEAGNYGVCVGLTRNMMTDFDTARYFLVDSSAPSRWLELSRLYSPNVDRKGWTQQQKNLADEFQDSAIRRKLEDKHYQSSASGYRFMSEAGHTTAWGLMFYGKPDWAEFMHFTLTALPEHDLFWGLVTASMAVGFAGQLAAVLLDVGSIRESESSKAEHLRGFLGAFDEGKSDYLVNTANPMLDMAHKVWRGEIKVPDGWKPGDPVDLTADK